MTIETSRARDVGLIYCVGLSDIQIDGRARRHMPDRFVLTSGRRNFREWTSWAAELLATGTTADPSSNTLMITSASHDHRASFPLMQQVLNKLEDRGERVASLALVGTDHTGPYNSNDTCATARLLAQAMKDRLGGRR